jgi:hypothetical protein
VRVAFIMVAEIIISASSFVQGFQSEHQVLHIKMIAN